MHARYKYNNMKKTRNSPKKEYYSKRTTFHWTCGISETINLFKNIPYGAPYIPILGTLARCLHISQRNRVNKLNSTHWTITITPTTKSSLHLATTPKQRHVVIYENCLQNQIKLNFFCFAWILLFDVLWEFLQHFQLYCT